MGAPGMRQGAHVAAFARSRVADSATMLREYRPGSNGTGRRRGDPQALGGRRCRDDNGLRGPRTGPMGARPVPLPRRHHGDQPMADGERHGRRLRTVFGEVGVPADALEARFVNGFMYTRLRPLIRPDHPGTKLPPAIVLRVTTRVHPAFRKRERTAANSFRTRPWVGRRLPVGHGDQTGADRPEPAAPIGRRRHAGRRRTGPPPRRAARALSDEHRAALLAARPRHRADRPLPLRRPALGHCPRRTRSPPCRERRRRPVLRCASSPAFVRSSMPPAPLRHRWRRFGPCRRRWPARSTSTWPNGASSS